MSYIYTNLYQMITQTGVSFKVMSDLIGISEDAFCEKLQGVSPWYLSEAMLICQYFHTTDVKHLFSN